MTKRPPLLMHMNLSQWISRLALVCSLLWIHGAANAQPVTIAAASDLRFALDEIITQWTVRNPEHPIRVIYGSSGRFATQIRQVHPSISICLQTLPTRTHYIRTGSRPGRQPPMPSAGSCSGVVTRKGSNQPRWASGKSAETACYRPSVPRALWGQSPGSLASEGPLEHCRTPSRLRREYFGHGADGRVRGR